MMGHVEECSSGCWVICVFSGGESFIVFIRRVEKNRLRVMSTVISNLLRLLLTLKQPSRTLFRLLVAFIPLERIS
jgi:hypothetical protein